MVSIGTCEVACDDDIGCSCDHTCPKSVSVLDSNWFASEKQLLDEGRLSIEFCLFHGLNETGTAKLWPLRNSLCSWTAFRRRWQPGFHYLGQSCTKSPFKATFRTSSLRIPWFLDSSELRSNRTGASCDIVQGDGMEAFRDNCTLWGIPQAWCEGMFSGCL